jgi:hypothetical protein
MDCRHLIKVLAVKMLPHAVRLSKTAVMVKENNSLWLCGISWSFSARRYCKPQWLYRDVMILLAGA